jgi:hypothetical protein
MTPSRTWLLLVATLLLSLPLPLHAEEAKPDDRVIFDVSAEDWVATKTARVTASVEAAVTGNTAGTMRASMTKAVNDLIKSDWRLTSFNRSQDQTGMERWSATFESRVVEDELNGINENAKKLSKAGMQLSVSNIDFTPTMEETQAALGQLRAKIYKIANEQLAALNTALPGRTYRIALINFTNSGDNSMPPMPLVKRGFGRGGSQMEMAVASAASAPSEPPMERSEKVTLTAQVVLAVTPPGAVSSAPAPMTAPAH